MKRYWRHKVFRNGHLWFTLVPAFEGWEAREWSSWKEAFVYAQYGIASENRTYATWFLKERNG